MKVDRYDRCQVGTSAKPPCQGFRGFLVARFKVVVVGMNDGRLVPTCMIVSQIVYRTASLHLCNAHEHNSTGDQRERYNASGYSR